MNKSVRRRCGGFTLLEVLIVVVIAVLVTLFAVPAYKKSQDKNRYMAASGVLMDLANAARMVKEDYPDLDVTVSLANASGACTDELTIAANPLLFMHCHKYLNPVPLTNTQYMGYNFVLSTQGNASCGNACKPASAVACMSGQNRIEEYTCAWVDKSGLLHNTTK